jgi:hypothetical protein
MTSKKAESFKLFKRHNGVKSIDRQKREFLKGGAEGGQKNTAQYTKRTI